MEYYLFSMISAKFQQVFSKTKANREKAVVQFYRRLCSSIVAGRFNWRKYCTPQSYFGHNICVIPLHSSYGQIGYTVYFPHSGMPDVEYDWEMNELTIDEMDFRSFLEEMQK